MSVLDQPTDVRKGEALDAKAVDAYLKGHIPELEGIPDIRQFPGGASNLTYLLQYPNRALILRRPPFGTRSKGAHDMLREARLIKQLSESFPYLPDILAICDDHHVIGADFYVMSRLEGVILRQDIPEELGMDADKNRALCEAFVDRLIALHSIDIDDAGLDYLSRGRGYVERQISGWARRYRKAMTDDVPDFEGVIGWLESNMPEDVGHCMIHNDYRFDNCVLDPDDPTSIIGVLDWELSTIGDPLMDLGNTLAYWIEADDPPQMQIMRRQPTNAPGMMTRDEVIAYYLEHSPFETEDFLFYRIYGIFRVAGILQQIYYRYVHGETQDERFAPFGSMVTYLDAHATSLID